MNNEEHLKNFLETKKENYHDIFEDSIDCNTIKFQTSVIGTDLIYATMHLIAQRLLLKIDHLKQSSERRTLLDVGSQFSFISFASMFFDVTYTEPRIEPIKFSTPGLCNIIGIPGEAQNLPLKDNTFDYVTSFHAIEHFGLGRYGDTLDYFGDQKGIAEFSRVLKPGGFLITGVPAAKKSKIEFNGQRKYFSEDFDRIVSNVGLKKEKGLLSYHPGIFKDGRLFDVEKSIEYYPEHYTPPVYISVHRK